MQCAHKSPCNVLGAYCMLCAHCARFAQSLYMTIPKLHSSAYYQ